MSLLLTSVPSAYPIAHDFSIPVKRQGQTSHPICFCLQKYAMLPQHSLEDNKHSNSLRNSRSRMCARINWAKPHCCRSLASKKTRVKKHGYPKKNPHLLEAMTMIGQK